MIRRYLEHAHVGRNIGTHFDRDDIPNDEVRGIDF